MASSLGTDTQMGIQIVDLVIKTSKSICEIARILKSNETNNDLKRFYGHLVYHCTVVPDQVKRLRSTASPANDFVAQILDLFESLVSDQLAPQHPAQLHNYDKQRTLHRRWAVLRDQENDAKVQFINQCLDVVKSPGMRPGQALDDALRTCVEDMIIAYPEDSSQVLSEDLPPREPRDEPSYLVWNTAQSLFKALTKSTECECNPKHELSATLCLGTYRNPDLADSNNFDICLSLQEDWQEAGVHTIRENVVKFDVNDDPPFLQKKSLKHKKKHVKKLCEQLKGNRLTSHRLELEVERGRLWKLQSSKRKMLIDGAQPFVSLQQIIAKGSLTAKMKKILAVLLSYAVLHLHGTPWLQSTWDSSHILFFRTPSSKIPLRPFIQTQLRFEGSDLDLNSSQDQAGADYSNHDPNSSDDVSSDDSDDIDPDDIEHPVPTLVTLAIMLMELYLATPFRDLANKYHIELPEQPVSRTRHLDVAAVFEECRHEIPQNSPFYWAIEKCLDLITWEDEREERMDDQTLRVAIYREVVRPLEDELCDAFTTISIDELDQMAQAVDMQSWGQSSHSHMAEGIPSKTLFPSANRAVSSDPGRKSADDSGYNFARFYDDEKPSEDHFHTDYSGWKAKYRAVYDKYVTPYIQNPPQSAVRIAVLDSGVDDSLDAFDGGQIVTKYNWTSTKNRKSTIDRDGHGTFVANLLIDFAPDAELFVAKIADKGPPQPRHIAEAIQKAVDEWNVDIISMSFGFPTNQNADYRELQRALLHASSKEVLMFAAASNSGANLDRAYPARDSNVICVHSTDSKGNRSRFSPTAIANEVNLATIGENVESAWPAYLCHLENTSNDVQVKSGTSFATPIAAGIAAFLLQYARIHLSDVADMLKRQSAMKAVLVKIAEKTQTSIPRDNYYYISLSLYSDNLFGKDKHMIDMILTDIIGQ